MFVLSMVACVDYEFRELEPLEPAETRTDFFAIEGPPALEVLFVLDASCSMDVELERFRGGLGGLVGTWLAEDIEVRVAVAATDPAFVPTGWLVPDGTGDVGLRTWPTSTTGAHHEGLSVASAAVHRLGWTADAERHVVFYADDDDRSTPEAVVAFDALAADEELTVHALVRPPGVSCSQSMGVGTRYAAAAVATGGTVVDLCGELGSLQVVGEGVGARTRFPLTASPVPRSVRVRVSDVVGLERITEVRDATYDRERREVVLERGARAGQEVRIDYVLAAPSAD